MSTSLFVRAAGAIVIDDALAAIDREDGDLALADGDLASLRGPWPAASLLLYRRGHSSRGVHVTFDGARFAIRLLALSAPADYELAFRIAEVIGGDDGEVEVEAGDTIAVRDVRAKLGGAWMARDMAVGVTALRTSLATGATVQINGPVRGLELTRAALATTEPLEMIEILRRAQVVADEAPAPDAAPASERPPEVDAEAQLDEAHLAALDADEQALAPASDGATGAALAPAPASAKKAGLGWMLLGLAALLVLGPPALVVRLVTWPLRGWLRDRTYARADRRRERVRAGLAEATAKLDAAPDDVDLRHARAHWLLADRKVARADRELVDCLRRLDAGAAARTPRAALWQNLAVARDRLRLPRLSAQAHQRALELGHVVRRRPLVPFLARTLAEMFVLFAGLAPD